MALVDGGLEAAPLTEAKTWLCVLIIGLVVFGAIGPVTWR